MANEQKAIVKKGLMNEWHTSAGFLFMLSAAFLPFWLKQKAQEPYGENRGTVQSREFILFYLLPFLTHGPDE